MGMLKAIFNSPHARRACTARRFYGQSIQINHSKRATPMKVIGFVRKSIAWQSAKVYLGSCETEIPTGNKQSGKSFFFLAKKNTSRR